MPSTILLGSSGEDVRRLQRCFVRMKLAPITSIDGTFGPDTDQRVREFQQGNGLVVDGIVGPATWAKLPPYREASPLLRLGATGPVVAMLQQALAKDPALTDGFAGPIDGIFGAQTEDAVVALQTHLSIPVDGVVGPITWMSPLGAAGLTLEVAAGLVP